MFMCLCMIVKHEEIVNKGFTCLFPWRDGILMSSNSNSKSESCAEECEIESELDITEMGGDTLRVKGSTS